MSSWLGYTVYRANGVNLEEYRETLTLELDDTVVEESVRVTHTIDRELRDPDDGYFPEYAARLHPHEDRKGETDRNRDYLAEFEEEFGYRSLTFYG